MRINKTCKNLIKSSLALLLLILGVLLTYTAAYADEVMDVEITKNADEESNEISEEKSSDEEAAKCIHIEEVLAAVRPTCHSLGLTEGVICSECGQILVPQEEIPALDHEWKEVEEVIPTYTEAGYIISKCKNCEEEKHDQVIHPDGLPDSPCKDGNYYYFLNNKILNIQTVAGNAYGWWNVVGGKVVFETTIGLNENGSWYLKNGKVDFGANGWISVNGETYYVTGGKVRTDITGIFYAQINGINAWWYVEKGHISHEDTVASNSNGWWCIRDGRVDFGYNGIASNEHGDWCIENGKVDFTKNGIFPVSVKGESGWWYVRGGKVSYVDTVASNSNGWWCVEHGKVNFTATKLASNANGWWYCVNGKVDFSFNGVVSNENGDWYVANGKVDFTKNDIINISVNGEKAWWLFKNGRVNYINSIEKNANGSWYIADGKVDFSQNGLVRYPGAGDESNYFFYVINGNVQQLDGINLIDNEWYYFESGRTYKYCFTVAGNSYGWWCIRGGKVDFSFNGIASNKNGNWLIKDGKVDFSYSGPYTYNGVTYTIKNGCQYRNCTNNTVFFGDSWTASYRINEFDSYARIICQMENSNAFNYSVGGAGFSDWGYCKYNRIISQVEEADKKMSLKDKLYTTKVVIAGGWNDANNYNGIEKSKMIPEYVEEVITAAMAAFPNADICFYYGNEALYELEYMDTYRQWQKDVTSYIREKYPQVAVYTGFDAILNKNPDYYQEDGLHPNEAGQIIIAQTITGMIK